MRIAPVKVGRGQHHEPGAAAIRQADKRHLHFVVDRISRGMT